MSHLRQIPGELELQMLLGPFFMAFAIPALFYRGDLFHWNPGWATTQLFPIVYWSVFALAIIALLWSRRIFWLLVIALILAATAPRIAQLILVALLVT